MWTFHDALGQHLPCVLLELHIACGPGWRIHGGVEDTKLSTNKQHSLSLTLLDLPAVLSLWSCASAFSCLPQRAIPVSVPT
jgi:hypothetical protein